MILNYKLFTLFMAIMCTTQSQNCQFPNTQKITYVGIGIVGCIGLYVTYSVLSHGLKSIYKQPCENAFNGYCIVQKDGKVCQALMILDIKNCIAFKSKLASVDLNNNDCLISISIRPFQGSYEDYSYKQQDSFDDYGDRIISYEPDFSKAKFIMSNNMERISLSEEPYYLTVQNSGHGFSIDTQKKTIFFNPQDGLFLCNDRML